MKKYSIFWMVYSVITSLIILGFLISDLPFEKLTSNTQGAVLSHPRKVVLSQPIPKKIVGVKKGKSFPNSINPEAVTHDLVLSAIENTRNENGTHDYRWDSWEGRLLRPAKGIGAGGVFYLFYSPRNEGFVFVDIANVTPLLNCGIGSSHPRPPILSYYEVRSPEHGDVTVVNGTISGKDMNLYELICEREWKKPY